MAKQPRAPSQQQQSEEARRPKCGIVRPIADMEPYPPGHWTEVHDILDEAVSAAGYEARLVSDNESIGVILGNIVSNLYNDPVVICDVSGRNPNVLFELGMRIAFEKPTIIITDDVTPFSFDISPVKHLIYPHSLRFKNIVNFKEEVSSAITATVASANDPNTRGYLQQFGPIKATELGSQIVTAAEIVEDLREIRRSIRALQGRPTPQLRRSTSVDNPHFIGLSGLSKQKRATLLAELEALQSVASIETIKLGDEDNFRIEPAESRDAMMKEIFPLRDRLGISPEA